MLFITGLTSNTGNLYNVMKERGTAHRFRPGGDSKGVFTKCSRRRFTKYGDGHMIFYHYYAIVRYAYLTDFCMLMGEGVFISGIFPVERT